MNYEHLKDNQLVWKWLPEDDKEFLLSVKNLNKMMFMDKNGYYQVHKGLESQGVVYRLRGNYQPESEVKIPGKYYEKLGDIRTFVDIFNELIVWAHSIEKRLTKLEG